MDNSVVHKLTFDEKISIMKWRASQPSGLPSHYLYNLVENIELDFVETGLKEKDLVGLKAQF